MLGLRRVAPRRLNGVVLRAAVTRPTSAPLHPKLDYAIALGIRPTRSVAWSAAQMSSIRPSSTNIWMQVTPSRLLPTNKYEKLNCPCPKNKQTQETNSHLWFFASCVIVALSFSLCFISSRSKCNQHDINQKTCIKFFVFLFFPFFQTLGHNQVKSRNYSTWPTPWSNWFRQLNDENVCINFWSNTWDLWFFTPVTLNGIFL